MKIKQVDDLESALSGLSSSISDIIDEQVKVEKRDQADIVEHHFVNFKSDESLSVVDLGVILNDSSLPYENILWSSHQINTEDYNNRVIAQSQILGIVLKTSTFTLEASNAGKYIRYNSANEGDCVVPLQSSVSLPINTIITLRQVGVGTLTVTPASGVTLYGTTVCGGQHKGMRLIKVDTNVWDVTAC